MNREFKFRVWKDGMMFYTDRGGIEVYFDDVPWDVSLSGELMQSLGYKDKNGKEMYDGDILRLVNGKTGWVSYRVEDAGYIFNGVISDEPQDGKLVTAFLRYVGPSESEIIGNIFENPELK